MPSESHVYRPEDWPSSSFRALAEAVESAVFIIHGTKYRYVNSVAERLTGFSKAELQGMDFWEILHSEDRDAARPLAMGGRQGHKVPNKYPIRIVHRKGYVRLVNLTASLIDLDGELAIMGVVQDITQDENQRLRIEEQLRQAQKMEAIGTLVGGIAHDFNNILAGITGNTHLARMFAGDAEKTVGKLEKIDQLSFRAAGMIRQLLAFARKDMVDMRPFAVKAFVAETMALVRMDIDRDIDLRVDVDVPDDLLVRGDVSQLQQVMMNLVNNACAALEGCPRPEIRVSVTPFVADDAFVQAHARIEGREFVQISIADNGCGMDEDTKARIFEPFFTTKEVGRGSGLGLSMVYGAVQMHGGVLEVESTPNSGSIFHINLPPYIREAEPESAGQSTELLSGHGECILYADDDPGVLASGSEIMRSLGYRVMTASDGQKAVDMFRERAGEIDLVVLDVVMPELDGLQAAQAIQALQRDARLIFVTGYDKTESLLGLDNVSAGDVLIKPYSVASLSQVIRRKLGK